MNFKIEFAWQSDTGKLRKNNEDTALVDQNLNLAIVATPASDRMRWTVLRERWILSETLWALAPAR